MTMADYAYKRLTRDRIPRQFAVVSAGRVGLWLGSDHLLLVESSGFTETYKRFYFRDIQAITVRETMRRKIWNAVLMVPIAVCIILIVIIAIRQVNLAAIVMWSIFLGILLVPFIMNNIRGPACACQLRTAVQIEDLISLSRIRQAHKVLDKIRPLIVAAQGQISPEEVSARMQQAASPQTAPQKPEAPPSAPLPPAPPVLS